MKKKYLLILTAALVLLSGLSWLWYDSHVDRSGWETTPQGLIYKDFYGDRVTGWQTMAGTRFYFREDGILATGWLRLEEGSYYLKDSGAAQVGWATIGGESYCFDDTGRMRTGWVEGRYLGSDGTPHCGWLTDTENTMYLDSSGSPCCGWLELDGSRYYFTEDGALVTGWAELEGERYHFSPEGAMTTGWLEEEDKFYFFDADGLMQTGWLQEGQYRYYLTDSGAAQTGPSQIDGQQYYFTPRGIQVVLVNPWNYMPEDYSPQLVQTTGYHQVDGICVEELEKMLSDCADAGHKPLLASSYRTYSHQAGLYQKKVKYWKEQGYADYTARQLAGTSVAIPGTSEHQLGLAVDIIDSHYTNMDRKQASTETQKWLMEHCWEYGFILRYPDGSSEITGIIYEPWHYRYVGREISLELRDLGITLEEYLGAEQTQE